MSAQMRKHGAAIECCRLSSDGLGSSFWIRHAYRAASPNSSSPSDTSFCAGRVRADARMTFGGCGFAWMEAWSCDRMVWCCIMQCLNYFQGLLCPTASISCV